jgi:cellulose synthase/poly-beta-1,6-N-acetylglucosamine synthase-like glycosyltransferase
MPFLLCVIPAHNEELYLTRTLDSLKLVHYPTDRYATLVLADNCTDNTASIARAANVRVIERSHPTRRSKGYALEDTIPSLLRPSDGPPPDALIIIDADTVVAPDALHAFAARLNRGSDFIQGLDIVGNPLASWRTKLMALGFALFNGSYLEGGAFWGVGAHLRGNGMCLSRRGLERHPWHTSGLAEDLEFSWSLRLGGAFVDFAANAVFFADMPESSQGSDTQRLRWEKGRGSLWGNLRARVWSTPVSTLRKLLWSIDLTMIPLTTMVALFGLGFLLTLLPAPSEFEAFARFLSSLRGLLTVGLALYVLPAFFFYKLPWRILDATLVLPYYAFWRLIISLGKTPQHWIRTARGDEK